MGIKIKPVYVVFDASGFPRFCSTNAAGAWSGYVVWHFGSVLGGLRDRDFRVKKRKLVRDGYRCYRMVKG